MSEIIPLGYAAASCPQCKSTQLTQTGELDNPDTRIVCTGCGASFGVEEFRATISDDDAIKAQLIEKAKEFAKELFSKR